MSSTLAVASVGDAGAADGAGDTTDEVVASGVFVELISSGFWAIGAGADAVGTTGVAGKAAAGSDGAAVVGMPVAAGAVPTVGPTGFASGFPPVGRGATAGAGAGRSTRTPAPIC